MAFLHKALRLGATSLLTISIISIDYVMGQSAKAEVSSDVVQTPTPETAAPVVDPVIEATANNWSDPQLIHELSHEPTRFERKASDGFVPRLSTYPIDISPDGRTLVSVGSTSIRLWSLETGTEIGDPLELTQGTTGWGARSVAFSPNGALLSIASSGSVQIQDSGMSISASNGVIETWNVAEKRQIAVDTEGMSGLNHQLLWGNSGLAFYGRCRGGGCIRISDDLNQEGLSMRTVPLGSDQFFAMHDSAEFLVNSEFNFSSGLKLEFLDLRNGNNVGPFTFSGTSPNSSEERGNAANARRALALSPDESLLVLSQTASAIYVLDATDLRQQLSDTRIGGVSRIEPGHENPIVFMAVSPDNQVLATASADEPVHLWNIGTSELITTIDTPANHLAFSPDGQHLVLSSATGAIEVYSPE